MITFSSEIIENSGAKGSAKGILNCLLDIKIKEDNKLNIKRITRNHAFISTN